ncbi:hypothetical protein GGR95_001627 [Sulfitobacter undariae]|uniref:Transposase n=1 Tax=Sulfitobacter undariae TaxID=1563671 RepID=A0A7W6E3B7_9RHOB|nr:hypothetical protein [Sulfitobacter undariae]
MSNLYWRTEHQMARLRLYFPKSHGVARVDDTSRIERYCFYQSQWLTVV